MAKKKNYVKRAKHLSAMALIVMTALGWLLSGYTILLNNNLRRQGAIISTAKFYLEDKLYVRAASQYKLALSTYQTEKNLDYEAELLDIYRKAGMEEDYHALIDKRMAAGTAGLAEYRNRAQSYIGQGLETKAIPVLQQGIDLFQDDGLVALYESISYAYSPLTTTYTELRMPSADWYLPAFDGKHWGYIGKNGRMVLDFVYEEALHFSGNYAVVKVNGTYTLIDKQGYWNAVDKNGLNLVKSIAGARLVGVKDGRCRIYSNTFTPLGDDSYDDAYLSENGLIAVQKDGKWAILDADFKEVAGYQFVDVAVNSKGQVFSGNYAVVADEHGYFLIDRNGKACFEERFQDAKGIEEGLFAVMDSSGRWGFCNEKAELIVECQYEDVYSFSNRLAAVKYAGNWGYINRYNTMVIEPQFASAYPFLAGSALAVDELGNYRILTLKYYKLF